METAQAPNTSTPALSIFALDRTYYTIITGELLQLKPKEPEIVTLYVLKMTLPRPSNYSIALDFSINIM